MTLNELSKPILFILSFAWCKKDQVIQNRLADYSANGVTGFVVPRCDPKALAEKIALLADNPELRQSFGLAGWTESGAYLPSKNNWTLGKNSTGSCCECR